MGGTLLFISSVAVERFHSASKRFAALLFATGALGASYLLLAAGPSAFSVVIDAGSQGTRAPRPRHNIILMKMNLEKRRVIIRAYIRVSL